MCFFLKIQWMDKQLTDIPSATHGCCLTAQEVRLTASWQFVARLAHQIFIGRTVGLQHTDDLHVVENCSKLSQHSSIAQRKRLATSPVW